MNEYLNNFYKAIKQDCDHYKSKQSIDARKIMVKVQNNLNKVKENYQK